MLRRHAYHLRPALAIAVLGAIAASGCASAHAQKQTELPPLDVPAPPARVLPPLEGGPIDAAAPGAATEPPAEGQEPARRPAAPRGETPRGDVRTEPPRTDTPQEQPTPPEAPPAAEPPAPTLQLAPPGTAPHAEQQVRQQLALAQRDLNGVDYGALPVDARAQYDTAKRFMLLAEQAIKDRNLIFAQTLADKAAAIAAVLLRK
jgi:hypothetical protein